MRRRNLLRLGAGSAILLALAGGTVALVEPGLTVHGRMSRSARNVMRHVARAVLDGLLPVPTSEARAAIEAHLDRLDATLAMFPAAMRSELSQLLALLATSPGRLMLAGLTPEWERASTSEIGAALEAMRSSRLNLRAQAYHALRDLTNAAWFADPRTWSAIGYDGPIAV